MEVTYFGTEIRMEWARSYGHYRISQYNKRGDLIYENVVTDSMAFDDYNDLRKDYYNSENEKREKLKKVRQCLHWDKYNNMPYNGFRSKAEYKWFKQKYLNKGAEKSTI